MKKNVLFLILFFNLTNCFSQVGIGTTNPKSTLDIVGKPTITTEIDGILPPRILRSELINKTGYGTNQIGALIYVTDLSGTNNAVTVNVIEIGYYYFDGLVWKKVSNKNEYGDVKQGFQTADHGGWIKLNGRLISTLTTRQQTQATALGFGTNLPDATDKTLKQKASVNTTGGTNTATILQTNIPNYYLPVAQNPNDGGYAAGYATAVHYGMTSNGGGSASTTDRGSVGNIANGLVKSGGSGVALNIENSYLSVNMFIYLGN